MYFTCPTAETFLEDFEQFIECHSEPVAALGPYAQFRVMKLAREHAVVTLDGQGADEELAGYHYFFGSYFKQLLLEFDVRTLTREIAAYLRKYRSLLAFKFFLLYLIPRFLKDSLSQFAHNYIAPELSASSRNWANVRSSNLRCSGDHISTP